MFTGLLQTEKRNYVRHCLQVEVRPNTQTETVAMNIQRNYSTCLDDDGRLKRTGWL